MFSWGFLLINLELISSLHMKETNAVSRAYLEEVSCKEFLAYLSLQALWNLSLREALTSTCIMSVTTAECK